MARLSYLLLSSLAILGASAASSVLDLIPDNFDKVVLQSGKPALVEFFAPWCGHCKTLAPIYEELATNFAFASDKVSIAKVDADNHKSLGKQFGVQGFPTLKWFDGKSDKPVDYTGGRDLESLTKWVTEKTGLKMKKKTAAPSAVEMLNDKSFKAEIGGDKDVLVAFTAPWCGRMFFLPSRRLLFTDTNLDISDCKTLAPIWETLAQDFASEPTVLVAKVDAEAENAKATAEDQGVKSYPTIKYFPKGSTTPVAYEGGRTEQDLVAYLNEHAGTHRAVGGGLDAKAGTIEALDTIIGKFTTGATIASITEDATKAAKGLKDKYAEYYVKVIGKMTASSGYAEKELARLEGMLKKGGLAPEKLDDLVSRTNVLRVFTSKDNVKSEL